MRFHLFDKVIQFVPGKSGVGVKNVTLGEDFFNRHYGLTPLMPEPLIIEAMAQMGGWTIALSTGWQYVGILLRIDKVNFYRPVRPRHPASKPGDEAAPPHFFFLDGIVLMVIIFTGANM